MCVGKFSWPWEFFRFVPTSKHVETRQEVRKVIVVEKVHEVQQVQEVVEGEQAENN